MKITNLNKVQKIGLGAGILFLVVLAALVLLTLQPTGSDTLDENNEIPFTVKEGCEYEIEQGVLQLALNNNDTVICECAESLEEIESCRVNVMNNRYYLQAVENLDSSLCEKITDSTGSEACLKVVAQGENFVATNIPQVLAETHITKQEYDNAIEILEPRVDANGEDLQSILYLTIAYSNKALYEHKQEELIPEAISLVEQAKQIAPEYPEVYRVEGFVYEVKPDLVLSINAYTKAIELDPNYFDAYVGRGHAYNKLGSLPSAVEDFEKAKSIDTEKDYIEVYSQLCRIYASNTEFIEDAIDNCNLVLSDGTADYDSIIGVHLVLGEIYLAQEEYELAFSNFDSALAYNPKSPDVRVAFANYYNRRGEYEEAQEQSELAIAEDPLRAAAHMTLAFSLLKQGELDRAEREALDGLEYVDIDPSLLQPVKPSIREDLYFILADIYEAKGDYENMQKYTELGEGVYE